MEDDDYNLDYPEDDDYNLDYPEDDDYNLDYPEDDDYNSDNPAEKEEDFNSDKERADWEDRMKEMEAAKMKRLEDCRERLVAAEKKAIFGEECKNAYRIITSAMYSERVEPQRFAARVIPAFYNYFYDDEYTIFEDYLDMADNQDHDVKLEAIRGLAQLGKYMLREKLEAIIHRLSHLLGQFPVDLLDDEVARATVHQTLQSFLQHDLKNSLTALINTVEEPYSSESRHNIICFIRDKVLPVQLGLLIPRDEMERYFTNLVKQNLQYVTMEDLKVLMECLTSLNLFGPDAPVNRAQELVRILQGHADLDVKFDSLDIDHTAQFISCLQMALPQFMRGASSSKFFNYLIEQISPVFDELPADLKLDLFKNVAESSLYVNAEDCRQLLPSIVQLLKKYTVSVENMNFTLIESLLYTFHQLAHKAPHATNSLCGYAFFYEQHSDPFDEDFSTEYEDFTTEYEDFTKRLTTLEKLVVIQKEYILAEHNNAITIFRSCRNILTMTQPLHSKVPSFIGGETINLSWKAAATSISGAGAGQKRQTFASTIEERAAKKSRWRIWVQPINKNKL